MSSTGGFGEEPIIMRMHMSGTAQFVGDTEAMIAALKGLQAEMAQLTAASRANAAAMTAQGNASAASAAKQGAAAKKSSTFLSGLSKGLRSSGQSMKLAGEKLTRGLTVPIALVGTVAIKSSLDFQRSMLMIQTSAGKGANEVKSMTKWIHGLAGKQPFDPKQLASAVVQIEKIGYSGKKAREIMKGSIMAATIGKGDITEMASVTAGAMTAGVRGKPGRIAALIGAAASAGGTTLPEMLQAFGTGILPYSKLYGFSLKDTLAALALTSDEHTKPAFAAARMRTAFAYLATPTLKGRKELARIGLSRFTLARMMKDQSAGGMKRTLDLLHERLLWASGGDEKDPRYLAALNEILPTGRGAIIAQLMNQRERLGFKGRQISNIANNTPQNFRRTLLNPQVALQTKVSGIKDSLIQLGDVLTPVIIPALIKLMGLISRLILWFTKLSPSTRKWAIVMLVLLAVLGPILVVLGAFVLALGALISMPVAIAVGIGIMVAGLIWAYTHFETFRKVVDFFWKVLKGVFHWIVSNWGSLKTIITMAMMPFIWAPYLIYKYWGKIESFFSGMFGSIKHDALAFIHTIEHLLHLLHIDLGGGAPKAKPKQVIGRWGTGASLFGPNVQGGTVNTHWRPVSQPNRHMSRGANPLSPNPVFNPFGTEPLVQDVHIHTHLGEREVAKSVTRQTILSKMHH